jgi:hypothetical protein
LAPASLGVRGSNQRLWGYLVTGNYFEVLGCNRRWVDCCSLLMT